MNISVVIVNWNVRDLLARCLASVEAEARGFPGRVDTIVVDNASSDGSAVMVRGRFSIVTLIQNGTNRGFSAACNQGIRASSGEAVLLLNPDAELQPGSLAALADALERRPKVAVVGPRLLNADGSPQSSRRRFPTLATAFLESTILQSCFPDLPHLRRYYCLDRPDDLAQAVDWLMGACLLLRRSALDEVGLLDERFFMYFEETDWCKRAQEADWRVLYQPQAQVRHLAGQSSAQDLSRSHIYFTDSKAKYYAKHFGPVVGRLVRWLLMLDYALRLAEEGVKLALGHKPALRRERIAMYRAVLRWGLAR